MKKISKRFMLTTGICASFGILFFLGPVHAEAMGFSQFFHDLFSSQPASQSSAAVGASNINLKKNVATSTKIVVATKKIVSTIVAPVTKIDELEAQAPDLIASIKSITTPLVSKVGEIRKSENDRVKEIFLKLKTRAELLNKKYGDYNRVCGVYDEPQDAVFAQAQTTFTDYSGEPAICSIPSMPREAYTWALTTKLKNSADGMWYWCIDSLGQGIALNNKMERYPRDSWACKGDFIPAYYLYASSTVRSATADMSTNANTARRKPEIMITSPKPGEKIARGMPYQIKWVIKNPDNIPSILSLTATNVNPGQPINVFQNCWDSFENQKIKACKDINPDITSGQGYTWIVPSTVSADDYILSASLNDKFTNNLLATSTNNPKFTLTAQ